MEKSVSSVDTTSRVLPLHSGQECQPSVSSIQTNDDNQKGGECISCHLCAIEVPRRFINEHYKSDKHRINTKIADVALERVQKLLHYNIVSDFDEPESLYFCPQCVIALNPKDRQSHEKSVLHKKALTVDKFLYDFYVLYANDDGDSDIARECEAIVAVQSKTSNTSNARNTSSNTLNTSSDTPNTSSDTPNTSSDTPNTSSNTPNTSSNTPNTSSDTPNTSSNTPNTSSNTPNTSSDTPNTSSDTPNTSSNTPNTSSNIPNTSSNTPNTSSNTRNTSSDTPNTSSNTPNTSSNIPNTSSNTRNTSSDTPNTSSNTRNTSSDTLDASQVDKSQFCTFGTNKNQTLCKICKVYVPNKTGNLLSHQKGFRHKEVLRQLKKYQNNNV